MVPKVNLADPNVEPTDAELEALSEAAVETAYALHIFAEARFQAEMREMLCRSRETATIKTG